MPWTLLKCECGKGYLPQRWIVVILISMAIIISYGQRVNFSMVLSEMALKENKTSPPCPKPENVSSSPKKHQAKQQAWDQKQQGILLASFYIGYVIMHLPGGFISDRFGSRLIFTLSMLVSSILTLVFPFTIDAGFAAVCVARAVIGLAQASVYPNSTTLMGRWVPKSERGLMGGISFAASSWGVIVGNLLSGVFEQALGWPAAFYSWGAFGVVWYFFALIWLYSDPDTDPLITEREKTYLDESIKKKEVNVKLDVKGILSDPAIWAVIAGQFGHSYLFFFLATNMPKYVADVLSVPMKDNMWANSIPYFLQWVASVASGKLGDYNISKNGWNVTFVRKLYTTIASVLPSICLLAIPYVGCDFIVVVVLMSLALFTMGPFYCGLKVNIIDLSQNFAGFIMAIVNGLGAIAGCLNPYICAWIAYDVNAFAIHMMAGNTLEQWIVVMWVIFAVASVTNIIYIIWGKAERRPWDMNDEEKAEYKEKAQIDKEDRKARIQAVKEEKRAAKEAAKEAKTPKEEKPPKEE